MNLKIKTKHIFLTKKAKKKKNKKKEKWLYNNN